MVVGTVPWVWLILTPDPGHARGRNLVPFRDLENQIHIGYAYAAMQIGGNLLVFAALGFLPADPVPGRAVASCSRSARSARRRSRPCSGICGWAGSRRSTT